VDIVTETKIQRQRPDNYFSDWKEREALAESMIPLVGKLYRQNNVKIYIYGRSLYNLSVVNIMKLHRHVRQIENNELSEFETFPIIQHLANMDLGAANIDIGLLAIQHEKENTKAPVSVQEFIASKVSDIIGLDCKPLEKPQDVVLYGFGRIGRLLARLLIEKTGGGDTLRLKAIVIRKGPKDDLEKRASLWRMDSVHGQFEGTIRVDEERQSLVANGNEVRVIYADSPNNIDYTSYGINDAIIIDNTGKWTDREGLSLHLQSKGVRKALLTAPGKGDLKNIVFGINDAEIQDSDTIITAASCTTNAIAPPLKVIDQEFGVEYGHLETIHAYTNDQNLIDNNHKKNRRGRAAALNMVITSTGAASAVSKVLPGLEGKLSGSAIRVPTPNVSLAILNLTLNKATSVEEMNDFMKSVALHSPLHQQIDYSISKEVVSSDFVGTRCACIFDSQATVVTGKNCVLYFWYDNEFGYSCQVQRVLNKMSGVKLLCIPEEV
jgi:glyceraldehyde 3-phosphate dehydrogenase